MYLRGDGAIMSVDIPAGASFTPGTPRVLFTTAPGSPTNPWRCAFDVSADGQRVLLSVPVDRAEPSAITVVVNWMALLDR
jgi:hypothetical protein